MNWFQRLLNNPNAHLALGAFSYAASFIPAAAPFVPILNAVTGVATVSGALLPGGAALSPASNNPPATSMHHGDYAGLAAAIAAAISASKDAAKQSK